MFGSIIQPNGAVSGGNPFDTKDIIYTKQWTVSDFSGGTSASFTLSSADNTAIRNCKTLLITIEYGNSDLSMQNVLDSLVVDMSPVASGKRLNARVECDALSTDITRKGTMRAQLNIIDYDNLTILDIVTTTDYINDQWSSGHKWKITVYKLA